MIEIDQKYAEEARARFASLNTTRTLLERRDRVAISASRLYAYVQGGGDQDVKQALGHDLALRRAYRTLLANQNRFHIVQAIAASTDEFPERHTEGCKIRLQASRAQEDQLYLIIELSDKRTDSPKSMAVFGLDESCETLDLPAQRNGVIQTIIERHSRLAALLGDPKSEIFLR